MIREDDKIPIIETYRGIGIHWQQSAARVAVVKAAIDAVHDLSDARALAAYAADVGRPPEARLLAAARCEACFELAAEAREKRPVVDILRVRASVVGLASARRADLDHYASIFDVCPPGQDRRVRRETPLTAEQRGR